MDVSSLLRAIRTNDPKYRCVRVPLGTPIKPLAEALAQNNTINQLCLSDNESMTMSELCEILEAASNMSSLRVLDVARMALDEEMLLHVIEFAANCSSLERLDVSENFFTEPAAWALGEAIKFHPSLKTLTVSQVDLGDLGARAFFEAATVDGCRLHKIDISYNGMTKLIADFLADFVCANKHLNVVKTHGNFIPGTAIDRMAPALAVNSSALKRKQSEHRIVAANSQLMFLANLSESGYPFDALNFLHARLAEDAVAC